MSKSGDRKWGCPVCGTEHDRDVNAPVNLYLYSLSHFTGGRVELSRAEARGKCSASGTGTCPVYEVSLIEAGSSTFYKLK